MKILSTTGNGDLARVYVADMGQKRYVEFVESVQPPVPREEKWVLIISTLFGCPVGCSMCDAGGGGYHGALTKDEMLGQIDHLIRSRFPDGSVTIPKLKVQFARMGEPALNHAVTDVLLELPKRYHAPGLLPCISTVAPAAREPFFARLKRIKDTFYPNGQFQLQFSIHTTDKKKRDELIPIRKWTFDQIARYGRSFREGGDRKITLNFALAKDMPVDPKILLRHFHPEDFLIKITPLNPTVRLQKSGLQSYIDPNSAGNYPIATELEDQGFEVLVSIGELEENQIGSNCGQYIQHYLSSKNKVEGAYQAAGEMEKEEIVSL
jgi:23S rRNA (adenine2503-C2)-methyltransferase